MNQGFFLAAPSPPPRLRSSESLLTEPQVREPEISSSHPSPGLAHVDPVKDSQVSKSSRVSASGMVGRQSWSVIFSWMYIEKCCKVTEARMVLSHTPDPRQRPERAPFFRVVVQASQFYTKSSWSVPYIFSMLGSSSLPLFLFLCSPIANIIPLKLFSSNWVVLMFTFQEV